MATYFFETITAAQAATFNTAGGDQLVFTNGTSSGAKMTVIYTQPTPLVPETITLIDNSDGRSVTFGPGLQGAGETGHTVIFPDGSNLVVGLDGVAPAANDGPVTGTFFGDGMFGGGGDDTLNAGDGNDLLQGNSG